MCGGCFQQSQIANCMQTASDVDADEDDDEDEDDAAGTRQNEGSRSQLHSLNA